jgi:hypothetical protein
MSSWRRVTGSGRMERDLMGEEPTVDPVVENTSTTPTTEPPEGSRATLGDALTETWNPVPVTDITKEGEAECGDTAAIVPSHDQRMKDAAIDRDSSETDNIKMADDEDMGIPWSCPREASPQRAMAAPSPAPST